VQLGRYRERGRYVTNFSQGLFHWMDVRLYEQDTTRIDLNQWSVRVTGVAEFVMRCLH
jgi:hypothetical protein